MLKESEVVAIATFTANQFEKQKRFLRIAIDEAIWRRKFFVSDANLNEIRRSKLFTAPSERRCTSNAETHTRSLCGKS